MSISKFDARQIISKDSLQQLLPNLSGQELDNLLRSINYDITQLLRMDANSPASYIINVGSGVSHNLESNRKRSIPHLQGVIPSFTSGTITLPAASGGTIVVSPGINITLTVPSNQYIKALVYLDSSSNLNLALGTPNAVQNLANVPAAPANTLPIGFISIFNNAGVIAFVSQQDLTQFDLIAPVTSGGGGGGGSSWKAGSQPISNGVDTVAITFTNAEADVSHILLPMLENTVDANPQALQIISVIKNTNGFTIKLNAPTDSNNYKIIYIAPSRILTSGEVALSLNDVTGAISLGIQENGTSYGAMAILQNIVDAAPQFQPAVLTAQSASGFTLSWNSPVDSNNYKLAYVKTATAEVSIASSVTFKTISLPIDYGTSNYALFAMMKNTSDASVQYQPLYISAKSSTSATISWEDPTDSANYKLVYYAISFA